VPPLQRAHRRSQQSPRLTWGTGQANEADRGVGGAEGGATHLGLTYRWCTTPMAAVRPGPWQMRHCSVEPPGASTVDRGA